MKHNQSNFKSRLSPPKASCSCCGRLMAEDEIFCRDCYTLIPRVKQMLDLYPERHRLYYIAESRRNAHTCPHCATKHIVPNKKIMYTPVMFCPNCKEYFLSGVRREIHIMMSFTKIYPILISLVLSYIVFCCIINALNPTLKMGVIILLASYAITIPFVIWVYLRQKRRSALRFEKNPEYLQILYDLGYPHKIAPQFERQIIKKVFYSRGR